MLHVVAEHHVHSFIMCHMNTKNHYGASSAAQNSPCITMSSPACAYCTELNLGKPPPPPPPLHARTPPTNIGAVVTFTASSTSPPAICSRRNDVMMPAPPYTIRRSSP
jgi:hypothetical protein